MAAAPKKQQERKFFALVTNTDFNETAKRGPFSNKEEAERDVQESFDDDSFSEFSIDTDRLGRFEIEIFEVTNVHEYYVELAGVQLKERKRL